MTQDETNNKYDKMLSELDENCLRFKAITALKGFRQSWVDLGAFLTDVAYGGDYKEWGYDDFELYCARELGLKKPTVKKLMTSYNYMKKHEPARLSDDSEQKAFVPGYETIALLSRAENDKADGDEDYVKRAHEMAFSGEEDETILCKQIREYLKPSETSERVANATATRGQEINDILRTARALRRKVINSKAVPEGLRERIAQGFDFFCLAQWLFLGWKNAILSKRFPPISDRPACGTELFCCFFAGVPEFDDKTCGL